MVRVSGPNKGSDYWEIILCMCHILAHFVSRGTDSLCSSYLSKEVHESNSLERYRVFL